MDYYNCSLKKDRTIKNSLDFGLPKAKLKRHIDELYVDYTVKEAINNFTDIDSLRKFCNYLKEYY